ncbi:MAG: cysteine--tRNA ligase [Actinomycetes bacterium]
MKTGLSLYDTQSRVLKEVSASDGHSVRIYCCGPTVYRDAHVGNLRTFLLGDLVARSLKIIGVAIEVVQNITDVGHMSENIDEDKMLVEAQRTNQDPFSIAREYEARFHTDLAGLNINSTDHYPRASDSIELMHQLISQLIVNGNAYVGADGSVYFAAQTFEGYGAISGNRLDALKPGHRYEYVEGGAKRFHADWALWKAAGSRTEMVWNSPWGLGFPGWHIECTAMSLHYLHSHVDLHIGGIDLRFPHHENERAQSNSYLASRGENQEAVDLWLHGEHLLFEGRKMSKSAGNVVLLKDLPERGFDPLSLRLCFLENRYRSQMDLSWDAIAAAHETISRWRQRISLWRTTGNPDLLRTGSECELLLNFAKDDLDTPRIIQRLRVLEKSQDFDPADKADIFLYIDSLLGLDLDREPTARAPISSETQELLELRSRARMAKDFARSDLLRDQLLELGVEVVDTPTGQEWKLTKRGGQSQ